MRDRRADSTKHLSQLLQQTTKETDPVEHGKLGTEIWRVLREQEHLSDSPRQIASNVPRLTFSPQGRAAKTHG
jgi:hypothetical protein